jgi:hypothetical protein
MDAIAQIKAIDAMAEWPFLLLYVAVVDFPGNAGS